MRLAVQFVVDDGSAGLRDRRDRSRRMSEPPPACRRRGTRCIHPHQHGRPSCRRNGRDGWQSRSRRPRHSRAAGAVGSGGTIDGGAGVELAARRLAPAVRSMEAREVGRQPGTSWPLDVPRAEGILRAARAGAATAACHAAKTRRARTQGTDRATYAPARGKRLFLERGRDVSRRSKVVLYPWAGEVLNVKHADLAQSKA